MPSYQFMQSSIKELISNSKISRKGKKVLFVGNDVNYFITHRLVQARAVLNAGYDVHVALPNNGDLKEIVDEFEFYYFPLVRWKGSVKDELSTIVGLYRIFKNVSPDLVYLVTIKPVLFGGLLARLMNIPAMITTITGLGYVFLASGIKANIVRFMVKSVYKLSLGHRNSITIFQNYDDQRYFQERGMVKKENSVLIRGSGVDINKFVSSTENGEIPIVMLPTRMLRDKGVYEFVEAADLLKKQGVRANFVLVGDVEKENPSSIKRVELENWDNQEIINWWGYRDDMQYVLSLAHIVCLPSYREGLPKVLIEAAACGRAIVATDVPGCNEIVKHGINGLLVPAKNAESLADGIKRLLENPELRRKLGKQGREAVEKYYTIEYVIYRFLEIADELLLINVNNKT